MANAKIGIAILWLGNRKIGSSPKFPWIVESLKDLYDVDIITMSHPNFEFLNEIWGTSIHTKDVTVIRAARSFGGDNLKGVAFKYALLGRFCKKVASRYDVMISAYNTMDFGKRGIQVIGDFLFSEELRKGYYPTLDEGQKAWFHRNTLPRKVYLGISKMIYSPSKDMIRSNLTVANSRWSKSILKESEGIDAKILYPPVVVDNRLEIPWENREPGFVCISNLIPFKQIERSIEILEMVRKKGFDVHLHIIGRYQDPFYGAMIRDLCAKNKDWCFYEGDLWGSIKFDIIAAHRYGINCCQFEAFGMAVAEMVKMGSIVWVPAGGGQVEIVDHPNLIYQHHEDAVEKIVSVLQEEKIQKNLKVHLARRAEKLSMDLFKNGVQDIVSSFLRGQ